MKNWALIFVGVVSCAIGCGHRHAAYNTGIGDKRLTCLVLGNDSIIYYTGPSEQMKDVRMGRITDTVFVDAMFEKIKSGDLPMVIKPGGGSDMLPNFRAIVNLANNYEVYRRSVDSGDANENKSFGFVTPDMVKAAMRGEEPKPLKLNLALPRDEPDTPNAISKFPKASQLVVLISGDHDVYAYIGGDIQKGRKYTYEELTEFLKKKGSSKDFSVVIKPSKSSTYKNTVDMLDEMHIANIQHYALVDMTKEEEGYLHRIGLD